VRWKVRGPGQPETIEGFRLSTQQQTLWRSADAATDPVGCTVSVTGPIADAELLGALESLVDANEILRTSFQRLPEMALPLQVVRDQGAVRWSSKEISRSSRGSSDSSCEELIAKVRNEQTDLGNGPLLAALFVRRQNEPAVLYLQLPAAAADARTMANLAGQLGETIEARRNGHAVPPPGLQYVQFSEWRYELAAAGDEESAAGAEYWARCGVPGPDADTPALNLAPGARRTASPASLRLGVDVTERLDRMERRLGAGPDAIVLAAWCYLASRLADRPDVVVETLFDGRRVDQFQRSLGPFTDRLPVRMDVRPERTGEAVVGEIAGVLAAHREWLEFAPGADLPPVAGQFGFAYLEHPARRRHGTLELAITSLSDRVFCSGPALSCRRMGQELVADLTVAPAAGDGQLHCAEDVAGYFAAALDSLLDNPDRRLDTLALLGPVQRSELLGRFGTGARRPSEPASFPELFAGAAARTPDAVALVYGETQLSYARLDRESTRLARLLRVRGVGRGDVVAFSLERGRLAVTVMLGILKADAAFLAVDPADPPARKAFLCADAGAVLMIAGTPEAGQEPASGCPTVVLPDDLRHEPAEAGVPACALQGTDAAYVCYTSGTTGAPNGVVVQHGSLVNYLRWVNREVAPDVVLPCVSRLTFDASFKQVLGPLLHGGRVWLLPEETLADPRLLFQALCGQAAAGCPVGFNGVPALWSAILKAAEEAPPGDAEAFRRGVRSVLLGGEAVPPSLIARTEAFLPGARLWNLYGPTEATANASGGRVGQAHGLSIGRPIDNARVLLLDRSLEPVPVGMRGRLFVAGAGVARCYLGHPGLTASRFRPHPFPDQPGDRIYDTGDMGRFLPDGSIEFLGRDDLQVKINGFRLELEGVEAAMSRLPGVREAALAAHQTASGVTELVGYLVPDSPAPLPMPELRSMLLRTLPRYAVPTQIVQVGELPRTRTAKLDRPALAELARTEERGSPAAGLRSLTEAEVAGIWARLLRVASIGPDDSFFALGGHSLLTVELISRVGEATGIQLPQGAVFEAPTLREFSARIEAELAGSGGITLPALEPVPRDGHLPISFSQQRTLLLESLEPGQRWHNVLGARRIVGTVDEDAVRLALATIAARHEILRTGFVAGPAPAQIIKPEVAVPLTVTDLGQRDGDSGLAEVQRRADLLLDQAFSLQSPPLMRAELVRLGDGDAVLLVVLHRLVCDGWAKTLLFDEFASLYRAAITGMPASLPELAVQYADFAAWERRCVTEQVLAEQLTYWRGRLAGTSPLRMPVDHPRTRAPSRRGYSVHRRLPAELTQVLRDLSMAAGSTLFMTTLAAFAFVLAYYSGQSDVVVVTPVTARRRTELKPVIGPFLNLLVLRIDLTSDPSFAILLRRVRETALAASARQDLPFDRLAEELLTERGGSRSSAFPVMFNYMHAAEQEADLGPGTALRAVDLEPGTSAHDLELLIEEGPENLLAHLVADLDLYEITTAERVLATFEAVLHSVGEEPDRPMSEHFRSVSLDRAVAGPKPVERNTRNRGGIARVLTARARACAQLPAVRTASASISYGDLDSRSNQLAHYLIAQGVVPGQVVALLTDTPADLVALMVAVVKIGAGFLPLSGQDSAERLRQVLTDCQPAVLVTVRELAGRIGSAAPAVVCLDDEEDDIRACPADSPAVPDPDLRHAACVIPSAQAGAVISHESLVSAMTKRSAYYAEPVVSMLSPGPADSERFVAATFWTLCSGGCVVLPPTGDYEPSRLARVIDDHQVTHLMTTPSLYLALHGGPDPVRLGSLGTVIVCGEPLYGPQVERHFRELPDTGLFNEYGGPECGGWGLVYECSRQDAGLNLVPVSASLAGSQWRVLTRSWLQAPDGVDGELFAGGRYSAAGYAGRHQALAAATFVPDPLADEPGARMYRTGDLARVRLDGGVTVLGPLDEQVRFPGLLEHRVPQEQAVAELLRQAEVRDAAVVARTDAQVGRGLLTAYLVPAGGGQVDTERLLLRLRSALPDHLVPGRCVWLDELPRTPGGAIDRAALAGALPAEPEADAVGAEAADGQDGLMASLAGIWADEFAIPRVTVEDDFFALGGNSLLALHLLARIEDEFEVTLPLQALFEAPTVKELASVVQEFLDMEEASGAPGYGPR
jgi:amino acid adenylation domain-containing protein